MVFVHLPGNREVSWDGCSGWTASRGSNMRTRGRWTRALWWSGVRGSEHAPPPPPPLRDPPQDPPHSDITCPRSASPPPPRWYTTLHMPTANHQHLCAAMANSSNCLHEKLSSYCCLYLHDKTLTVYFMPCKQLLLFVFARRSVCQYSMAEENSAAQRQTTVTAVTAVCLCSVVCQYSMADENPAAQRQTAVGL